MNMPIQKPGKSKQNYETPRDFITAVEHKFGKIDIDLAADESNTKAPDYISIEDDSLATPWDIGNKLAWLNPPFGHIAPWAKKCLTESTNAATGGTGRILLLTPASVGSEWFANHVWKRAVVIALRGRLTFVGETHPYPKDCMLSVFSLWATPSRLYFDVWDWRKEC